MYVCMYVCRYVGMVWYVCMYECVYTTHHTLADYDEFKGTPGTNKCQK